MINFCKQLELNENRCCFWYIVMLCKFISITGICRSPESDFLYFLSPYLLSFEGENCSTYYLFHIGSFNFCGRPTAEVDFKKKTFWNSEAWVNNRLQLHYHVWRKCSSTTISCKQVHSSLKIAFLENLVRDQVMITKREQLAKFQWSSIEKFWKLCHKQYDSTIIFLTHVLAILKDTVALCYHQIYRWVIRSPNMTHTSE